MSRSDMLMVRKAARERWPIKPETRAKLAGILDDLASNEGKPDRTRIAAAKALVDMDRLNLQDEVAGAELETMARLEALERLADEAERGYLGASCGGGGEAEGCPSSEVPDSESGVVPTAADAAPASVPGLPGA